MKKLKIINSLASISVFSCLVVTAQLPATKSPIRFITLDPGHFHAALIQKTMYPGVDSTVHVYAPPGTDVQLHLDRINAYNSRSDQPTHWKQKVYTGNDY